MRALLGAFTWASLAVLTPSNGFAWGNEGHEYIATLAAEILQADSPETLKKVDDILATDTGNDLTGTDIASEATWADAFRSSSQHAKDITEQWHFVDIDYDHPDVDAACFNHPRLTAGEEASQGPSPDCVIDKITQFADELGNSATSDDERLAALKFLLHFVGDIHQPLHAADHKDAHTGRDDRGGNCVGILRGHAQNPARLHSYWDTALVIHALSKGTDVAMGRLRPLLTEANKNKWLSNTGDDDWASKWAQESYQLAKDHAYAAVIDRNPVQTDFLFKDFHGNVDLKCGPSKVYTIDTAYDAQASEVVKEQIAKSAVRLSRLLQQKLK
jgi:hypothetical protein